jgi:hypothetical protein
VGARGGAGQTDLRRARSEAARRRSDDHSFEITRIFAGPFGCPVRAASARKANENTRRTTALPPRCAGSPATTTHPASPRGERKKGKGRERRGYLKIEKLISFSVMNSRRTGTPSRVLAMPRLSAGMISPGSVMRSP